MIHDIIGVNIFTTQLNVMAEFYRDVIGLKQHSDHGELITFDVRPGLRLNIGRHSQIWAEEALDPFRIMLNLGVDDIHTAHARMADNGAEFLRPPEQEAWGGWIATFRDPDGNVLQLMQQPDGSAEGEPDDASP